MDTEDPADAARRGILEELQERAWRTRILREEATLLAERLVANDAAIRALRLDLAEQTQRVREARETREKLERAYR